MFAVVFVVSFVFIPSMQAIDDAITPMEKRADLKAKIEAMRADIKANGYTFTVGMNPAMQYELEQLCNANPDLEQPYKYGTENKGLRRTTALEALPSYYVSPYVSSIKNQASCGSCWAFGQVGAFESSIMKTDGVEVDLSEQYLVSCNDLGYGCGGGWWAFDMFVDPGAILESCFPYTATDAPCDYSCGYSHIAQSWAFCEEAHEVTSIEAIKQAVYDYGGVCVCVYVDNYFQAYTSGVLNNCKRNPRRVNHMVMIVGWDDSTGAWRVKNSWGTGWGDNGFCWMIYNCNLIGYGASYVVY